MAYVVIALLVAVMSATPLPWPPSWVVLAVIAIEFDVSPVGVVVAGALGAAVARTGLAWTVGRFGPRVVGARQRENVEYLASRLEGRRGRLGMAALLAASPPPSWAINASAGLLAVPLAIVFGANLVGRSVVYAFGVGVTGAAAGDVTDRLKDAFGPVPVAISIALVGAAVWLLLSLDWRVLIERRRIRVRLPRRRSRGRPAGRVP